MIDMARVASTISAALLIASVGAACQGDEPAEPRCVVEYSRETLANREFAFDGTIVSFDVHAPLPPDPEDLGSEHKDYATFQVHEWFTGGTGPTVRIALDDFETPMKTGLPTSEGRERLLVSGDDQTAWLCGFTRRYSQRDARIWVEAFTQ